MDETEDKIEKVEVLKIKRKSGRPRKLYAKDEITNKLLHFREYQREYQKIAYHKKIQNKQKKVNINDDEILKTHTMLKNYSKGF